MSDRGSMRGRRRGGVVGRQNYQGHTRGNSYARPGPHLSSEENGELNAHLTERITGRGRSGPFDGSSRTDARPRTLVNPDIKTYVEAQSRITSQSDSKNWQSVPEIPPASEISIGNAAVLLPPNRIDKPWAKSEKYLKSHFMLLREDAISPLREAVMRFRNDPERMDDNETRIYEQVRVVGLTLTYKGIASRIRFSTSRSGRKINWSASKRLTSGTLVALSPTQDNFQHRCILAVVAARPLQNLEADAPEIDILFSEVEDHEIDPQNSYIMIEATQGYYEAYRHTLKALQKQANEVFPLHEHICHLQREIGPPEYVAKVPVRDMTPAADDTTQDSFQHVDILRNWPNTPNEVLDSSQWRAMKMILTKKLAIIQGPPGTGKTHVSKIAINIILRNRTSDDPPIIVACQTNHALDQLLTFVREFEPNFIRLGGRSTSAVIKKRSLYEVRKAEVIDDVQGGCFLSARRDIVTKQMGIKSLLSSISHEKNDPITAEVLKKLGVISDEQYQSLVKDATRWVRSDEGMDEPLQMWLGRNVSPFVAVYSQDNFGFEEAEEDLEMEQLRELDAEQGIADEEDFEMLKGDFIHLAEGHTIPKPSGPTIDNAKRHLDTTKELNRVPQHLRGPMYLVMQEKVRAILRRRLREIATIYAKTAEQIQIGRWEKDFVYLSRSPIIGMTTTGLSKYRALVSALKPKVILIEEAAEVLEAPVAVACVPSLEHLILVGDHQQLQAHCSVRELEGEPYYLNISMFERLVRNGVPHETLLRQRRMDPLFRGLLAPVYEQLEDHQSVITRPTTEWGMGKQISWFFKHDAHELQDETMSTFNQYEAQIIAKFYRHLVRNRVPARAITVLTFYNGQRKKILKALKSDPETASVYNKVKTVDSYQGEENHIIILSLVRSNFSGKIGFLDINNRVVVALSRAKYGLYIFGNGDFLAEHNEVWSYVEKYMHDRGLSDEKLPLTCSNHGRTVWIKHFDDFDNYDGGCTLPCGGQLACGHKCPLRCHVISHEWVECQLPCNKELFCGHYCRGQCKDTCRCDCEAFRNHEEELADGSADSFVPQRNAIASNGTTEDKMSRLLDGTAKMIITSDLRGPEHHRPARGTSDSRLEAVRAADGGRIRYESNYQDALNNGSQRFDQLQHEAESSKAPIGGQDVRKLQRGGGPGLGLDGAQDLVDEETRSNIGEIHPDTALEEKTIPRDDILFQWLEPEEREWEAEQRKAIANMGTECW